MSEARPREGARSRGAAAIKASRKGAGTASATISGSSRSRAAPRLTQARRDVTTAKPSPAQARSARPAISRDASTTEPSRTPVRARRRDADPSAGSRDASQRAIGAPPAGTRTAASRKPRSRDASAAEPSTPRVRQRRRDVDPSRGSRDASATEPTTPSKAGRRGVRPPTGSRDASATPARERAPKRSGYTCPPCGRFVPTEVDGVVFRTRTGSPPRFCSPGCRQAAYRRRQAGVAEDVALQLRGGRDRSLAQRKAAGDD